MERLGLGVHIADSTNENYETIASIWLLKRKVKKISIEITNYKKWCLILNITNCGIDIFHTKVKINRKGNENVVLSSSGRLYQLTR